MRHENKANLPVLSQPALLLLLYLGWLSVCRLLSASHTPFPSSLAACFRGNGFSLSHKQAHTPGLDCSNQADPHRHLPFLMPIHQQ